MAGTHVARATPIAEAGPDAAKPLAVALTDVDAGLATTIHADGRRRVWDVRGATPVLDGEAPVPGDVAVGLRSAALCRGRPRAIVVTAGGKVLRWDWDGTSAAASADVLLHHPGLGQAMSVVAASADGRLAAVAPVDVGGIVMVVALDGGRELDRVPIPLASGVLPTALAFAPDGSALFVGTARGTILRYRIDRD
jgi:hypothetical protein